MRIRILVLALFLTACGAPEEPAAEKEAPEGRAETRNIRNTDAIGYSGSQIADKVDATLDASDARKRQLEEEEQQPAD